MGDVKPPGSDICWRVDCFSTRSTKFYMGKSFLPGDAYPLTESSWHLGMYS
jgi:hypothetical protein